MLLKPKILHDLEGRKDMKRSMKVLNRLKFLVLIFPFMLFMLFKVDKVLSLMSLRGRMTKQSLGLCSSIRDSSG